MMRRLLLCSTLALAFGYVSAATADSGYHKRVYHAGNPGADPEIPLYVPTEGSFSEHPVVAGGFNVPTPGPVFDSTGAQRMAIIYQPASKVARKGTIMHLSDGPVTLDQVRCSPLLTLAETSGMSIAFLSPDSASDTWDAEDESELAYLTSAAAWIFETNLSTDPELQDLGYVYLTAEGSGSPLALKLAAEVNTMDISAVATFGGSIPPGTTSLEDLKTPIWLIDSDWRTISLFKEQNGVSYVGDKLDRKSRAYANPDNSAIKVFVTRTKSKRIESNHLLKNIGDLLFSKTARIYTFADPGFVFWPPRVVEIDSSRREVYDDQMLGDDGIPHSWEVYTPPGFDGSEQLPLVLGLHGGGSTTFQEANRMQMHKIGAEENFITIYPAATNEIEGRASWDYKDDLYDNAYLANLIDWAIEHYNVDPSRVYCMGFSMGSIETQAMGAMYPDKIAAIVAWGADVDPELDGEIGSYTEPSDVLQADYASRMALRLGLTAEEIEAMDIRMPIMRIQGLADQLAGPVEGNFTVENGSDTYKRQMHYWQDRNGIPQTIFDDGGPTFGDAYVGNTQDPNYQFKALDGAGNPVENGDYQLHLYYSEDAGAPNYYNFMWIRHLFHASSYEMSWYAWQFFQQFERDNTSFAIGDYTPNPIFN